MKNLILKNLILKLALKFLRFLPPEISSKISLVSIKFFFSLSKILIKKNESSEAKKYVYEMKALKFKNHLGLAAGLDKEGKYFASLAALGFSFIEVGTFTPKPQKGNNHPRILRIPDKDSLINRLGFNNPGIELGLKNVKKNMRNFHGILGLSIGKNKSTSLENAHRDYIYCLQRSYGLANYIALNISSPNTEGLRDLASKEYFESLIKEVSNKKNKLIKHHQKDVPVLLKISPDENRDTIENLINVSQYYGIDGFIVSNTTKAKLGNFEGGLSGKLLKEKSLNLLKIVNSIASNDSLIISSGGISSKEDLIERLDNGANLVQVYTSFVYEGPSLVDKLLN